MRKYIYIALLFLLCAGRASAQFTLVSGTVSDTNGLFWSCSTITASIVNNNGQSLYLNGVQFSPAPSSTKLGCPTDPSTSRTAGAFSMQLADNTQIKCGSGASIITCATQTQWLFLVNSPGIPPPAGTGPQTCTATLTISGGSQSVSASFSSCPALSIPNIGTSLGGPVMFYAGNPPYNVKADEVYVLDANWTIGSSAVTCPGNDCNFNASSDNGKLCWGIDVNTGTATLPTGTLTVTGPQSATCGPSTATTSKTGGIFSWCTDDTASWLALRAAYYASQRAAFIVGPGGHTCVTKAPLLDTRPNVHPAVMWQASFQSPNAMTIFVATPTFDFTTCGTVAGGDGGCMWDTAPTAGTDQSNLPQYSKLQNFGVTGLGLSVCGISGQNRKLVTFRRVEGANIWLWNWCEDSTSIGALITSPNAFYNLNMNQFGSASIQATGGASNSTTYINNSYVGQQSFTLLTMNAGANVISKGSFYLGCSGQCITIASGGTLTMDGDQLFGNSANQYVDVSGNLFLVNNVQLNAQNNGGSAVLTRATGKVVIRDSSIQESGVGGVALNVNTVPGGSIINAGNNTIGPGTDQTLLTAAMIVLSAGWGATATVTNPTGTPSSNPTRFSFQVNSAGAGQAANPTMAFTYPNVGSIPTWTCKQVGGTGTLTTISGEGTATGTTMTLTFNGTPVAGSNYIITCTGALQ